ncbi:MAG: hypothetical protein H7A38_04840 [Chlamydiales bacterium]|nr:hypothetical protein [Chlamydiales bacterium]
MATVTNTTPQAQTPVGPAPTTDQKVVTTSTPVVDHLWGVVAWGWATARGDYSVPQKAMKDTFEGKKTASQKLAHLISDYKTLGFSKPDAFVAFAEELLLEGAEKQPKAEFKDILAAMNGFRGVTQLAAALYAPESNSPEFMTSLKETLRKDPAYLLDETAKILAQRIPLENKAVYLDLFLSTNGVTDEQARICFEKLSQTEQQAILEADQHALKLEDLDVEALQKLVEAKITPLARAEVFKAFHTLRFKEMVLFMFDRKLDDAERRIIWEYQTERHSKETGAQIVDEDGKQMTLQASRLAQKPGFLSYFGMDSGFHHFMNHVQARPFGETAKASVDHLIAELKKAAAEEAAKAKAEAAKK